MVFLKVEGVGGMQAARTEKTRGNTRKEVRNKTVREKVSASFSYGTKNSR